MSAETNLKTQGIVLAGGFFLIVVSYLFIDKPVAHWVFSYHLRNTVWLERMTYIPEWLSALVFFAYPFVMLRFYLGKFAYLDRALLLIANSVVIALFYKDVLKYVFARISVDEWLSHHADMFRHQFFGFFWFKSGAEYGSFPSGHATVAAAAMIAFALAFPRYLFLSGLVMLLVMIGLVCLYYHYVSDVVAGFLLGYMIAVSGAVIARIHPSNAF